MNKFKKCVNCGIEVKDPDEGIVFCDNDCENEYMGN